MSKRKQVSAEEKRIRMLNLFHEKKEFYQLKELEKIAPKEKQIIVQAVKDVVQNLVDDGLVDTDKIGTSVYFWSFPSKTKISKKNALDNAKMQLDEYQKKLNKNLEIIEKEKVGKDVTNERKTLLDKIKDLEEEKLKLDNELKKYQDSNPAEYERMKKSIVVAKEAGNRWTDNVFSVKSWCKRKFFIEDSIIDKQFGIPSDLDYLE
ncbi:meiotic nuclear division protein 1 homolog [Sipha flava]|uniref:Meiotic nuclear division protein 1 homolog n=1 Tax=Sipha flava TaxID=143950 RepID=A0A8B8G945_9HEMI|nr:meiotic nuclear division protein 1 homolog [Sipha flava]XP_025419131.1 meiotic nuclear division protein 1 homolog [Sipha flava]XP_025419132.1 meiotic nuclear division protein 1 homolog [Sipha flava]